MPIFIFSGFMLINILNYNQALDLINKNYISRTKINFGTKRIIETVILKPKKQKIELKPFNTDSIYLYVDRSSRFKGGTKSLKKFLEEHINYPYYAYKNNITGRVDVIFIVNIDGSISKVVVERSSGNAELNNEAIRVVRMLSGKLKPARFQGRKVRSYARIPIIFELEEN